ncbi:MAG: hypothetical protein QF609_08675 [Gammaproteobacteria bacterium]|nr:hypothetical protein [Gammaproteobacteria bacterium]
MSLAARQLEERGIATVILGSAKDIVEYCGVPRFLFTDFPLGNPCGRPYDRDSQRRIMSGALGLLQEAKGPGTTVQTPDIWADGAAWKTNYMRVGPDNIAALRAAGDARRAEQAQVRERMTAAKPDS